MKLAVPDFGADRPDGVSDFNDLAAQRGADAIRECIAKARTVESALRPLTVQELLARPYPLWLVRGVLIERALGVAFGASGSGKTFAVFDMAAAIARGVSWFGRRVKSGGVVYVAAEGHLRLRVEAYLKHHGIAPENLNRLRIVPSRVNLLRAESNDIAELIAEITAAAADLGGIVPVVLDTLNAMMPGGDENASDDMGAMIAAARAIIEAVGCAVVYVHHTGKDEARGSRGHSSLKAASDLEFQLSGDGPARLVEVTKLRDGEAGQRFGFRLAAVDLGPDPDPDAEPDERFTSCVVVPGDIPNTTKTARRDVALDALRETLSEHGARLSAGTSTIPPGAKVVTLDQWQARWRLRTGDDYGDADVAAAAFRRERRKLIDAGTVQCSGRTVWIA